MPNLIEAYRQYKERRQEENNTAFTLYELIGQSTTPESNTFVSLLYQTFRDDRAALESLLLQHDPEISDEQKLENALHAPKIPGVTMKWDMAKDLAERFAKSGKIALTASFLHSIGGPFNLSEQATILAYAYMVKSTDPDLDQNTAQSYQTTIQRLQELSSKLPNDFDGTRIADRIAATKKQ